MIYTGNQLKNGVLVLWGDPANQDATDFYGFGINNATLRYNVPTGATHRFYVNNTDVFDISSSAVAINVGGLYLPGGGTPLSYYEEYTHASTHAFTIGAAIYTNTCYIKLVRTNTKVTAYFPRFVYTHPTGAEHNMFLTTPMPARFRPSVAADITMAYCPCVYIGNYSSGHCDVYNNGHLYAIPSQIKFVYGFSGFAPFNMSWEAA
jgi:hypothetical protein